VLGRFETVSQDVIWLADVWWKKVVSYYAAFPGKAMDEVFAPLAQMMESSEWKEWRDECRRMGEGEVWELEDDLEGKSRMFSRACWARSLAQRLDGEF